jgi:lipopolysaccharide transport system ATP-binding protein
MHDLAIRVEKLGKRYRIGQLQQRQDTLRDALTASLSAPLNLLRRNDGRGTGKTTADTIWALKDVSFEVRHGEIVGIIGHNGAGKSTLLKILSRITEPTEGRAEIHGRVGSLLEVGTGFHPELTGRENLYLSGAILGIKRAEIDRKFDEIIAFAEIEQFLDTPVKRYSSGMYVRLAFAVAAHLESEVLLVDEVLAVGDAAFQRKCLGKMEDTSREGRTILFVSHNMSAIKNLCKTAYLLSHGNIIFSGDVGDVIAQYLQNADQFANNDPLSIRTDRRGNGKLRFVDFIVHGVTHTNNTVQCGEPASFVIPYQGQPQLRNVYVSITFYTPLGERALYVGTDVVGKDFAEIRSNGAFVCSFQKVPLMPGIYIANIYCTVNGVVSDWVVDAARIQVIEGDYFGTGKLPPNGYGKVVAPHDWAVR